MIVDCGIFSLETSVSTLVYRISIIGRNPRAARPYLFSDGQNMYNRVVLVCTVNVYIPSSLGRRPILRYQEPQVPHVRKIVLILFTV